MARHRHSWSDFIYLLGFHHVITILLVIPIILMSILLAGCTSTGLVNVHLLSLSYTANYPDAVTSSPLQVNPGISQVFTGLVNATAAFEVRAGFMGMCMRESTGKWTCSTDASTLANSIKELRGTSGDPLNLIWVANKFRSQMVFSGLLFTAIFFISVAVIILFTFPHSHKDEDSDGSEREVTPFPSRLSRYAVLVISVVSSLFVLISIFWQHIGSSAGVVMGESLSYGSVQGHVGVAAMALGWASVFLIMLAAIGVIIMVTSINVLSEI